MSELPNGWVHAEIQGIADLSPKFNADLADDASVHFVPMSAVQENFGGLDASQLRPLGEVRKGYTYFAEGDVLFAKITPCMENGKGALVPQLSNRYAFGSTEFHVLRPSAVVTGTWLAHYLSQPEFRKLARHHMTGTAGQLRVPTKWLATVDVPVPPAAEQTRIIAKLEELLTDLDAGVAELKAAQKKLAQYRQSLLKAAVEGALTAEWRAEKQRAADDETCCRGGILPPANPSINEGGTKNPPAQRAAKCRPYETGAKLLARILAERRARWEAKQLAKFKEQGKTPPKDWRKKYPEPVKPDTSGFPELPEGWVWASVDQLSEFITSGSRGWADYYAKSGAMFIRSQNINRDWLNLSDIAYVNPPTTAEGARTKARRNDLLLTITGANVGKTARINSEINETYVSQHVALIRPVDSELADFLHSFLTTNAGGRGQLNNAAYGAGKPGLNLQQVAAVWVPLPPTQEIKELAIVLKSQLEAMELQEESIRHALKQSAAQRQNILRAAFCGQLVPQDPNDEPACALLERIRAERAIPRRGGILPPASVKQQRAAECRPYSLNTPQNKKKPRERKTKENLK
ncbi:MAG: restriction endonuclease subunit S [Azonexus sp.]|nr:restriction endonuclease subunit S [Azonexus sp.]